MQGYSIPSGGTVADIQQLAAGDQVITKEIIVSSVAVQSVVAEITMLDIISTTAIENAVKALPPEALQRGLNALLPPDVSIREAAEAPAAPKPQ